MSNRITYEQPLNERVRNLLRLEHLFDLIEQNMHELTAWHSRFVLEAMLEILDLMSRSDLKADLIKELEKDANIVNSYRDNPGVDPLRFDTIISTINELLAILKLGSFQPGTQLKNNELVTSFKQRIAIPGGTCNFDLPRFHHWLNLPESTVKENFLSWLGDLEPVQRSVELILNIIRMSSQPTMEKAEAGFYQKPIDSKVSCQLIRVVLPANSPFYPEISGGKHRFTIRFMENTSSDSRAIQATGTVDFELHCCLL